MTFEMILTFIILGGAIVLFVTEVIRVDLVGLVVLSALALTNLVEPEQALSGFSNPAVVTVWGMFILSAGLAHTGVSNMIGKQVMRFATGGDGRLISFLMTVTALLSGFMNNIGVAAIFLPITLDVARRTNRPASRLLLPMAYGSLLGGLILLIGTASNLIVRDALREAGYKPFGIFDFTIGGLVIMVISVAYMAIIGRRYLPIREPISPLSAANNRSVDIKGIYGLEERLAYLVLPEESFLAGKTLVDSRIGQALGLTVINIKQKNGQRVPAEVKTQLKGGDRLLILGRLDRIEEIAAHPFIVIEDDLPAISRLFSDIIGMAEFEVKPGSEFAGQTLAGMDFRHKFELNVIAIRQGDIIWRTNLQNISLGPGDCILAQGFLSDLNRLEKERSFRVLEVDEIHAFHLDVKGTAFHNQAVSGFKHITRFRHQPVASPSLNT